MRLFKVGDALSLLTSDIADDRVIGVSIDDTGEKIVIVAEHGYTYSNKYWLGYEVVVECMVDPVVDPVVDPTSVGDPVVDLSDNPVGNPATEHSISVKLETLTRLLSSMVLDGQKDQELELSAVTASDH